MVLMMVGKMMVMMRIMMVTMVMKIITIQDALVTMACVILAYHVKVKGEAKLATII